MGRLGLKEDWGYRKVKAIGRLSQQEGKGYAKTRPTEVSRPTGKLGL